jgi:hypothetical protein
MELARNFAVEYKRASTRSHAAARMGSNMEKCSRKLFVASLFALTCAGSALAQDAAKDAAKDPLSFEVADANHDGFLSRSEVPKQLNDLRAHFAQYDKDGDHRLSRSEYEDALVATRACDNREIAGQASKCDMRLNLANGNRHEPMPAGQTRGSSDAVGGANNNGGGGAGGNGGNSGGGKH